MTDAAYLELADPLRRYLRSRVGDADVAQDLLQEVFLRLHERRDTDELERIDSWMFRVARNVAIDYLRRREPVRSGLSSEPGELERPELSEQPNVVDDDHAARVLAAWLGTRVAALPERYREVLELTEQQGLSQREAADRLGLSYSTLKSRVQRGRDLLHADLIRCCEVELDARNRVTDFQPRADPCDCGETRPCAKPR